MTTVRPIDTLLALKVLSLPIGLTANARAVGAAILESYNRKTGQCDPGIDGIASLVGVNRRTVMRAIRSLENAGILRKLRHGGYSNRNQYEPDWRRCRELEAQWSARLRQRRSNRDPELSPSKGQSSHLQGDNTVAQTCSSNLQTKKHCSDGLPSKERATPRLQGVIAITPRSRDAAESAAERRWSYGLLRRFEKQPITYGQIVEAITPEIQKEATAAEQRHPGGGIAYLLRRLKLGDDRDTDRAPAPTANPTSGIDGFAGTDAASVSDREGSSVISSIRIPKTPTGEADDDGA